MNIPARQVKIRKIIGRNGLNPVWGLSVIGGLCLVAQPKGSAFEILGAAPRMGIAKAMALRTHPNIEFTEILKSDETDNLDDFIEIYEVWADQLNGALSGRL